MIDEAHKLRNAYRPSNKVGQGIRWATEDCRKLLLTATPLQNSLLELYGLSTLIDEHIFGDVNCVPLAVRQRRQQPRRPAAAPVRRSASARCATRSPSTSATPSGGRSRDRSRRPTTSTRSTRRSRHFCSDRDSYALPQRQRHLTALILRKLLASSSLAIAATLDTLRIATRNAPRRAGAKRSGVRRAPDRGGGDRGRPARRDPRRRTKNRHDCRRRPATIDRQKLREEIDILQRLAHWARSIGVDTKTRDAAQGARHRLRADGRRRAQRARR